MSINTLHNKHVTINNCANAVLATGGSPTMANEEPEIKEFTNTSTRK